MATVPLRAFVQMTTKSQTIETWRAKLPRGALSDFRSLQRPWVMQPNKRFPMPYVDGFVIPVQKDKVEIYKAHAKKAGEVWKELGALDFVECVGEDVPYGELTSFPRAVLAKD